MALDSVSQAQAAPSLEQELRLHILQRPEFLARFLRANAALLDIADPIDSTDASNDKLADFQRYHLRHLQRRLARETLFRQHLRADSLANAWSTERMHHACQDWMEIDSAEKAAEWTQHRAPELLQLDKVLFASELPQGGAGGSRAAGRTAQGGVGGGSGSAAH